MKLHFSAKERQVLEDRLTLTDCISEALTDVFPGDPEPPYSKDDAERRATQMLAELETHGTLTVDDVLSRDILDDLIDGSTWPYFIADAIENEDMTRSEAAAWRRVFRSIEKKAQVAGVSASYA